MQQTSLRKTVTLFHLTSYMFLDPVVSAKAGFVIAAELLGIRSPMLLSFLSEYHGCRFVFQPRSFHSTIKSFGYQLFVWKNFCYSKLTQFWEERFAVHIL